MSFPASRASLKLTGGTNLSFVMVGDTRDRSNLDGGHFLLEAHAAPAGVLIRDFVESAGRR
jgi:hypothetical protein